MGCNPVREWVKLSEFRLIKEISRKGKRECRSEVNLEKLTLSVNLLLAKQGKIFLVDQTF